LCIPGFFHCSKSIIRDTNNIVTIVTLQENFEHFNKENVIIDNYQSERSHRVVLSS